MSTSNLCSTSNYDVSETKASVQKELQALKQTINLQTHSVCSEAPTILITNYSHNNGTVKGSTQSHRSQTTINPKNSSSITIYTHNSDSESPANLPASSINILINNHFDRPLVEKVSATRKIDGMPASKNDSSSTFKALTAIKIEKSDNNVVHERTAIDSVTDAGTTNGWNSKNFSVDNDVLVQHCDGRIYLGTIIEVGKNKCLVKYDNNTKRWSDFEHVTNLDTCEDDSKPLCVVCKSTDDADQDVNTCGGCCRAYHQKCMKGVVIKTGVWHCKRCVAETSKISYKFKKNNSISGNPKLAKLENSAGNRLPYNLSVLTWDTHHRQNDQQIYCYCGKKGKWYMQMLQCARCLQWFHADCVKCLNYPLYFGDRFYLFACANCNHGVEFLRRLHVNIEDVVHLMLFNLSLHNSSCYYNLSNVIYPYIKDNWHALQLPPKLKNMISNDVKDEISKALRSYPKRFKPGREVKKKVLTWALKVRAPPQASHIALPPGPLLTEKYINDLFCDQARIHFLPQNVHNSTESVAIDAKMRTHMSGKNYAQFIDTSATSSSSEIDSGENVFTSASDEEWLADLVLKDQHNHLVDSNDCDNSLTGYETIMVKAKKRLSGGSGCIEPKKRGRPPKSDLRSDFSIDFCDSSDDTSSRGTLDSIIPPPKDFSGSNNPFLIDNSNSSSSLLNSNANLNNPAIGGMSGLNFTNSISKGATSSGYDKNHRIVRTVKRRLSAKDIMIGPNMEIKRRKLKKRTDENVEVISTSTLVDLQKSATYLPIRGDSKDISITALRSSIGGSSSSSNTLKKNISTGDLRANNRSLSGRRLRQRTEKSFANDPKFKSQTSGTTLGTTATDLSVLPHASNALALGGCSIPGSPIKGTVPDTYTDLQTSLNMYFGGVANRIANNESFIIRGKRVSLDGRLQYLIEWEGVS